MTDLEEKSLDEIEIPQQPDLELIKNKISNETQIKKEVVDKTIELLTTGNTIPFIARYRKEVTQGLDETKLRDINSNYHSFLNLEERKISILNLIHEQGKLNEDLKNNIVHADSLQKVEDFYLPYKRKYKTLGAKAKEKGLEPLSLLIREGVDAGTPEEHAQKYVNPEKGVESVEDALKGAKDIIAEDIGNEPEIREFVRKIVFKRAIVKTEEKEVEKGTILQDKNGKEVDPKTFEDYFSFSLENTRIKPYQILAINRAEKLDVISVDSETPDENLIHEIKKKVLSDQKPSKNIFYDYYESGIEAGYKRYVIGSIKREMRRKLTEEADEHAINVFAENLKNLLMQPPLKNKAIIGIDPGYRTGCKIAVIDKYGNYLDDDVIYPHSPQEKPKEAQMKILKLAKKYNAFTIAIGNGTASRETEQLVSDMIKKLTKGKYPMEYAIVNEAGASIYSASDVAIEEFPDLDLTVRGAISIARRLQDPLSELIKIDPKSIGVGLYQHDVNQKALRDELDAVIEYCVNSVGIELNTASSVLLSHVSGLSSYLGKKIVNYRKDNGPFKDRKQLLDVSGLGAKTFEQCAGFLKIRDAPNPLDRTFVHPESYELTENLLNEVGLNVQDLIDVENKEKTLKKLDKIRPKSLSEKYNISAENIRYLVLQLRKPDLDPRTELPSPILRQDVLKMEDLKVGMVVKGVVRNVVDFGAFMDIGVKVNGLVHKSEIANQFVKNPLDFVSVGDVRDVEIIDIDLNRSRIQLSLKNVEKKKKKKEKTKVNDEL